MTTALRTLGLLGLMLGLFALAFTDNFWVTLLVGVLLMVLGFEVMRRMVKES